MPTYLYECPICGEFEEQHSIAEVIEFCPTCKDNPVPVKRLISLCSFQLIGGKWAKSGYS